MAGLQTARGRRRGGGGGGGGAVGASATYRARGVAQRPRGDTRAE